MPNDDRSMGAVSAAAAALGIPLAPTMAERIAEGAEAAVAAVTRAMHQYGEAAVGEPADYLGLLENLALPPAGLPGAGGARQRDSLPAEYSAKREEPFAAVGCLDLDLCAAQHALEQHAAGCEALVEAALQRALAMQPQTHAWLDIDAQGARDRAKWLEQVLQAYANSTGSLTEAPSVDVSSARPSSMRLLGIPLAHKDMFNLPATGPRGSVGASGVRTPSCGSQVPSRLQSPGVATVIERLERAGAVTLGKLNMAEFAFGATGHNGSRGDCANAHHSDFISGGSSSGSAVAVARAAVFASLGSDTGGSVRIPAAVNGIFGLKPTYGLIPRTGSMKLAPSIDVIGPMARSARDLARVLTIVAGADGHDALCSQRAGEDYESALHTTAEGMQVGLPDRYFFEDVDPQVRVALDRLRETLERAGVRFKVVTLPDPSALAELSRAVVYAEATGLHAAMLRESAEEYSPQVRLRASTGLGIPAPVYLAALALRLPILEEFVTQVFSQCDALFTPTIPIPVPRRDATDVGAGDALWSILSRLVRCTAPFNYLGLPAITVPAGYDAAKLPIGAQFVARPFAESVLLRLAAAALPSGVPPVSVKPAAE